MIFLWFIGDAHHIPKFFFYFYQTCLIFQNIWNAATPNYALLQTLKPGHWRNIFDGEFVPQSNDHLVVSCGMDGEVRVTDVTKGSHGVSSLLGMLMTRS